jgi:L-galactose dehydrogenase
MVPTTRLGRTGLTVSVAGIGCGGHSRVGQGQGKSADYSISVIRQALDAGVNIIDTAAAYRTEEIVGRAIAGRRDQVVISTKVNINAPGSKARGSDFVSSAQFTAGVEEGLRRLGTDYVDILHLHGVEPHQYAPCRDELVPALERLRDAGKIRFLGLTERFLFDTGHKALAQAMTDDCWDVVMAGYNMINPSARGRVLEVALENDVGVLVMYAVRRALSNQTALKDMIAHLINEGAIDAGKIAPDDPLGFLTEREEVAGLVDAAYRFCRHAPGAPVVLTGTGSQEHMQQNLASLGRGPLPRACLTKLEDIFGEVDQVSGN